MATVNQSRYWSDAGYKRDVDRAGAWERISQRFDALAYRARVGVWLREATVGYQDSQDRYTVTARAVGSLTVTLSGGSVKTVTAPVPLI